MSSDVSECLSVGLVAVSDGDSFTAAERALSQVVVQLRHLVNVWSNILPDHIYSKALGQYWCICVVSWPASVLGAAIVMVCVVCLSTLSLPFCASMLQDSAKQSRRPTGFFQCFYTVCWVI